MSRDPITVEEVNTCLGQIRDPESGRPIGKTNQIHRVAVKDSEIDVEVGLTSFSLPLRKDFAEATVQRLTSTFPGMRPVVTVIEHERPPQPLGTVGLTSKAVIAVGSGKGGVGKSTAAASLAIALHRAGCKVGFLDADVYGPSIPQLTGVQGHVSKLGDKIGPLYFQGMPVMSIGFMVPPDQAVIWRGPMLHSAVTTFIRDVAWGNLDYLIIDMPPGTGDVALSLSQLLPVTGAVVVCTPQQVALIDAVKAVAMFQKVNIPVVGMIENMSGFLCPDNGIRYDIFGKGGAKDYSRQADIPFLGEIPIHIQLRERGDRGESGANFDDPLIAPFLEAIAYQLAKNLAERAAESPVRAQLPVLG
jgi:ATP-binding protein involved in chromosome partitioning